MSVLSSLSAHFRIIPFVVGIVSALVIFSIYTPSKEIIKQYPHPSETLQKVFRDPNKTCYSYTQHEVSCDANEATLKDYPIQ